MKKIIVMLFGIICASVAYTGEFNIKGLHCGGRGSFWGTLASEIAIPDYFPPENFLARFFLMNPLFSNLAICEEEYEAVHLGLSCKLHDECYMTLGASKDTCDEKLLTGWLQSCAERYNDSTEAGYHCLDACDKVVDFMYNAMRYDDGFFCPSCKAYEKDQELAMRALKVHNN